MAKITVTSIGKPTEKGYVVLGLRKTGKLGVGFYNMLLTEEQAEGIEMDQDISAEVGAYTVRNSEFIGEDGQKRTSRWIESI